MEDTDYRINSHQQLLDEINKLQQRVEELTLNSDKFKLVEKSFLEKEKNYKEIFNSVSDAIYIQDREGRFLDVNFGAVKMYGYSKEEFIGKTPEFLSAPGKNSMTKTLEALKKAFEGEVQTFEWWGKRKNGEIFPKEVVLNKGTFLGKDVIVATARDISERKKAESLQAALYAIAEKSSSTKDLDEFYYSMHQIIKEIMNADNFYIAIYDAENNTLSFPYFVDEIDEQPQSHKPGKGLTEYVLNSGEPLLAPPEVVERLIAENKIEDIGAPSIDWLGIPLKTIDKTIGVLVVQSYTEKVRYSEKDKYLLTFVSQHVAAALERKQSSEAIKKYSHELEELNKSKDKFFSIISHDLRSPFHPLLGLSEILANEIDSLSKEEISDYSKEIFNLLQNQYRLLEDLLDWSKLQRNTISFVPAEIQLNSVVNETLSLLRENAERKKILLVNLIDDSTVVKADKNLLRSILQNLISNAIKFSFENGEIEISAKEPALAKRVYSSSDKETDPEGSRKNEMIEICVYDSGVGLTSDEINNIFSFHLGHSKPGTKGEKGSGLGLILCKEMVEKHGGTIRIESEKGRGSKFYFTLPKIV